MFMKRENIVYGKYSVTSIDGYFLQFVATRYLQFKSFRVVLLVLHWPNEILQKKAWLDRSNEISSKLRNKKKCKDCLDIYIIYMLRLMWIIA